MDWALAVDPLALLVVGFGLFKVIRRVDKALATFKEDWNGTEARPGVPGRAGVMERLDTLEVGQRDTRYLVENLDRKVENKL